jgi:protoheme IX farnesyltransferase
MSAWAPYLALTKPRLLPLVLFTGLPALVLAGGGWPGTRLAVATLLGTALAAGAANALNSYLEREVDARMERTRTRPLPAGSISAPRALAFGLTLAALGLGTLALWCGAAAMALALAAILFYVFVYTLWLKPRTPFAVVLGGVSGAIAPLIADAAVDGQVGAAGLLLFAIIFVWQPPHFYAISIYRSADYSNARLPMLADRIGLEATLRRLVAWVVALVPITLAAAWLTPLGVLYALCAVALNAWFLLEALRLKRAGNEANAYRFFRVSLFYMGGLFLAMLADLAWTGVLLS